jgi:glycerol-3-phosphate dehydrogenase
MNTNKQIFDLAIIGGGINGTGIAADASGRNLNVFLCEQNDLASGTSSSSSKLIHGGLRYLEHYEFRLVKEALAEREVLLNKAPHLVSPLKFLMPHRPHLRPAWMIRCGLFLYDHLSKRNTLPKAKKVKLDTNSPFKAGITKGFEYYDCWVDDARLVITNAIEARNKGAEIKTQTQCKSIKFSKENQCWTVSLYDKILNKDYEITAKNIVNASGPWLNQFLETALPDIKPARKIRLIKGSHIIVPRNELHEGAYILQNEDKRIIFVLPYLEEFSIIGTTDKEYTGAPESVSIDEWEVNYLIEVYNKHFKTDLLKTDIISTYSGVRPLCDDESSDPSAITRDYTLELQPFSEKSALISIYGGKITTYRKLSEAVLLKLKPFLSENTKPWTTNSPLPGAAHYGQTLNEIQYKISTHHPWLSKELLTRLSKSYGLLCLDFLLQKTSKESLGYHFGANLYQTEIDYLIENEWACCADDILWRRTKIGLFLSPGQSKQVEQYVKEKISPKLNNKKLSTQEKLAV